MISLLHFRESLIRRIISGLLLFHSTAFLVAQDSAATQAPATNAAFRIAGVVVSSTGWNPLAHARVTIIDDKNPERRQSMVTDEGGRFDFKVGGGKYALQGTKRGYIAAAYEQHEQFSTAIVTGASLDTENLVLRLAPSAVLSGKILDELGNPVRHATVSLYREDRRVGIGRILKISGDSTDDQGAYEFSSLDAGTYFVSVTAKPWYANHPRSSEPGSPESETDNRTSAVDRSLDVAYPITYFGDSTEPDDATPIPIRGGDHLQADIHLNPVPALHLLFRVPDNGERGMSVPMLQRPSFDGVDTVQTDGMQQVSPGVFEINGVAPGRYSVRTPGSGDGNEANEINLTNDGQELNVAGAEAGANIKATVQVVGEAKLPPHLGVALRNSKMRVVAWQEVDAKSELEFQDVAPGKYEVLAFAQAKRYSVVRISSTGSETAGHILNVTAGSSLAVSFSLVGGAMSVEGFAKRAGKAAPGAMVVLVPKDPESHRDLFRRDQSDQDGSFSLRSVVPGSYTIVAIENGWDLDWSRPGVIAHYAEHGKIVTVSGGTQGSMHVPDAVEVQPR
jgi:protocatechuate 3,4-dioxygenase beta subunit